MGVGGQRHAMAAFVPGKSPVPVVQEAGWAPGPVWTSAENLASTGFEPWTVQAVASRYTDWAIPNLTILIELPVSVFVLIANRVKQIIIITAINKHKGMMTPKTAYSFSYTS